VVFLHACRVGLEGIVSKRLTAPYRFGPFRDWLKVKNPDSPAMIRAREHFARLRDGVNRATLYRLPYQRQRYLDQPFFMMLHYF
jgi:hypothetical protein